MAQDREHFAKRLGQLDYELGHYRDHWKELVDNISPRSARFLADDRSKQGTIRNSKIYDNTATIALRTLASGLMSGVTSPTRPWFQLRTPDPDLNEFKSAKEWLDLSRKRVAEAFLQSNLYSVLPSTYSDLGGIGTAAFAVEDGEADDLDDVIRCVQFPVGSYRLGTDYTGEVNACYREYQMQASQIVEQFGEENCSAAVRQAWKSGNANWFTIVHAIEPNERWNDQLHNSKFKEYLSVYYEKGDEEHRFLRESGFDEFPIMAPRWQTVGEDVYGISPGMEALGDIKGLQVMQKRKLQAIEKMVSPPMVAPVALRNQRASLLPGDVTYADVASGGQKFEPAYMVNVNLNYLMQEIQETQRRVRETFYSDLFMMIANDQRSNITAFEIAARQEEKLLALGPVYLKLNDELLDPLIDRTFNIMLRKGMLPPPPPELQGVKLNVEYVSVMAQAMKAIGVSNIERVMTFVGNMGQAFPSVLDTIDADTAVEEYADMVGVPPKMVNDKDTRKAIRDAKAKQDQAAQAMAMAQQGADAAQKLANAPLSDNNALSQLMSRMQQAQGAPA